MAALEADVAFDFASHPPPPAAGRWSSAAVDDDAVVFACYDSSLLDIPAANRRHARSSSKASSIYSAVSTVDSASDSACTRLSTPPRAGSPVRHHGPLLLPKIRSQDQNFDPSHDASSAAYFPSRTTPSPRPPGQPGRSYTSPDRPAAVFPHLSSSSSPSGRLMACPLDAASNPAPLLSSPVNFALSSAAMFPSSALPSRRSSMCCAADNHGCPVYSSVPRLVDPASSRGGHLDWALASYTPRAPSPLALVAPCPDPVPSIATTSLVDYLTAPNPAASLVRTIALPLRDANTRHFWWDVRNIRSWTSFNAEAVFALPGASALLTAPVPVPMLPQPSMPLRHPETEASLHAMYASFYVPKLGAALAISSSHPLRLSAPTKTAHGASDLLFVANADGDSAAAAALFGGRPSARLVGLVRSFDRFNTGMRAQGNIKRVEYLRGLAALQYAMREHGCRYGFILTEIELVLVRCGTDATPFFGDLEITAVQLALCRPEGGGASGAAAGTPLTACLALWGLCQLAADDTPPGHAHWRAEIGAPAEGTRRKVRPRDGWMPQPQLAEKREAKRSRGWVWPEDPVGRKELGRRGVRYGAL
ncbi:hypothetical protein CDD83_8478 [Cordyceps sp. RAO-2017]|nr:hypothetical protein CDD83_8478 [Cordyceps sp. RAO-2017]